MINPFDLMKKISEMKNTLQDLHVEDLSATGESGGGLVKVTLNGKLEMVDITLDPIVVDNRDVKMLQDLIMSAQNVAVAKMAEILKEKLGNELGIPGLAGLPL